MVQSAPHLVPRSAPLGKADTQVSRLVKTSLPLSCILSWDGQPRPPLAFNLWHFILLCVPSLIWLRVPLPCVLSTGRESHGAHQDRSSDPARQQQGRRESAAEVRSPCSCLLSSSTTHGPSQALRGHRASATHGPKDQRPGDRGGTPGGTPRTSCLNVPALFLPACRAPLV